MQDDPGPTEERRLVERACRDRDMLAFEVLYRKYVHRVHAFAYRRTGSASTADDVTSSTFERALRNLPSFRWRGAGFGAWLFRIAANELSEHFRTAKRAGPPRTERATRATWEHPVAESPEEQVLVRLDAEVVRICVGRLRPRYQEVISLRYLAGLDAGETAAVLGMRKPTLAVTLHRALAALRREIERTTSYRREGDE